MGTAKRKNNRYIRLDLEDKNTGQVWSLDKTLTEWLKFFNAKLSEAGLPTISKELARDRLRRGMRPIDALSKPPRPYQLSKKPKDGQCPTNTNTTK
jgi:hypothetical protein